MVEAGSLGQLPPSLDLIGHDRDTRDMDAEVVGQVPHRSADATSQLQDALPDRQPETLAEMPLVPAQRDRQRLTRVPGSKVKRIAPASLVELGDQLIVVAGKCRGSVRTTRRLRIEPADVL